MKKMCLFTILALAACHPRMTADQQLSMDKASCGNYGFKQGTKDFSNCMMTIDQNRKLHVIQQQQADAANMQSSAAMINAGQALTQQGHNSINCSTSQSGTFGNINCH